MCIKSVLVSILCTRCHWSICILQSLLGPGVEDNGDRLLAINLPQLDLDVLEEVVIAGVEAHL